MTFVAGAPAADNYVWVGPIAGSWDVAGNWEDTTAGLDPATVAPGSNDSVTINAAGSTVQVITGTGDSASLTINGATSLAGDFTTGALAVNSALTVNTGDTLAVSGNATFDGLFTLDGTLTAGSLTTDNGSFNITGGTLTAGSLTTEIGGFDLNAGATLAVTGDVSGSDIPISSFRQHVHGRRYFHLRVTTMFRIEAAARSSLPTWRSPLALSISMPTAPRQWKSARPAALRRAASPSTPA